MATKDLPNQKVGAGFQAAAFLIAFIGLAALFTIRYNLFITHDPYVPLFTNKQSDKKVIMGLHIAHFSNFNVAKNKFVLDGTLWFSFNPKIVSLENIKKFSIYNGSLLEISDPILIDHGDEKIAQFRIRTNFHTPLNYRMFPLDDHRVNLMVINRFLPPDVILSSDNADITFSSSMYLPGWEIISHGVRTGYREVILERSNKRYTDQQQEAIISLNCERTDPSIMINILLTLLLMLFLAMLTFSSDEDSVLIVTVGIVALIGYRTVMQTMAPPQVSYFIFSDYLYLFALIAIIVTLFGGIATRENVSNRKVKKCCITAIYTVFIVACSIAALFS